MPVKIVPYCHVDGVPTYKDSEVRKFFARIVRDGLKDIIFHAGDVTTENQFLARMKASTTSMYVVYADDIEAGLIWLTHFEGKSCRVHFTSFSEVWGMDTVSIGRDAIRQVLYMRDASGDYVFDVLLGLIPAQNIRAVKWLAKVGLVQACMIPNALWNGDESIPGTLLYLTRKEL